MAKTWGKAVGIVVLLCRGIDSHIFPCDNQIVPWRMGLGSGGARPIEVSSAIRDSRWESTVALFLSTFVNKVDLKGRVSVPAPFRAALGGQASPGIVVYRSFRQKMLEGCGIEFMEDLLSQLDELEQFTDEYDAMASLFADAVQLPFDSEGRILLPKGFADFAGIEYGQHITFAGAGRTFQLWNPAEYETHMGAVRSKGPGPKLRPRSKVAAP
jgi:MraZ protein